MTIFPLIFNLGGGTSFTLKESANRSWISIGVLEDNDDNDDTVSGNSDRVLSIRDKPEIVKFRFLPAVALPAPLRDANRAKAKTGAGEDATDADATAFCRAAASTRSKL